MSLEYFGNFVALIKRDGRPLEKDIDISSLTPGINCKVVRNRLLAFDSNVTYSDSSGQQLLSEGYLIREKSVKAYGDLNRTLTEHTGQDLLVSPGMFSFLRMTQNEIVCSSDFFGARQIYYSVSKENIIISNCMFWHTLVKRYCNECVSINYFAESALIFTGSAWCDNSSSVNEIKLLPVKSVLNIKTGSLGHKVSVDGLTPALSTLKNQVEAAAEEIKNNLCAWLAESNGKKKVLELSGGRDTRLVMAAFLGLNATDDLYFFSYGSKQSPDRVLASELAGVYDIPYLRPYQKENCSDQKLIDGAAFCGGMRAQDDSSFYVDDKIDNVFVFTGGFGESFKNLYLRPFMNPSLYEKLSFWGWAKSEKASATDYVWDKIITAHYAFNVLGKLDRRSGKDFHEFHRKTFDAFLRNAYDTYKSESLGDFTFELYLRFRNRFHFGLASTNRFQYFPSVDILYSPQAYLAATVDDPLLVGKNHIHELLLDILKPELQKFPFYDSQSNFPAQKHSTPANIRNKKMKFRNPSLSEKELYQSICTSTTRLIKGVSLNEKFMDYFAFQEDISKQKSFDSKLCKHLISPLLWMKIVDEVNKLPSRDTILLLGRKPSSFISID